MVGGLGPPLNPALILGLTIHTMILFFEPTDILSESTMQAG